MTQPASTGLRRRRVPAGLVAGCLIIGGAAWVMAHPAMTRQGVNYRVTAHAIPWHIKALEFYLRDAHYRRLASEITHGSATSEARALAILRWTRERIRPTPDGWPVIDDHIDHIIIRGHGEDDQIADVFTTLATYAGLPAFWKIVRARAGDQVLVLAFVRVDGRWTVWDVRRGFVFTRADGTLASIEELRTTPALVAAVAGTATYARQAYRVYVEDGLVSFAVPSMLRAHQQMPWRRALYEIQRPWRRRQRLASPATSMPLVGER